MPQNVKTSGAFTWYDNYQFTINNRKRSKQKHTFSNIWPTIFEIKKYANNVTKFLKDVKPY